jgi:hypothetical protein
MAEYDLNGWTVPDLINPDTLSFHKAAKPSARPAVKTSKAAGKSGKTKSAKKKPAR